LEIRRADSVRRRLSHAKPVSNRHPMNAIDLGNANALPRETGGADETGGYVGKMMSGLEAAPF